MFDTAKILRDHDPNWQPALQHSFLQQCKDGSVSPAAFDRWLEQDHLFVIAFKAFAEHVHNSAPEGDRTVLNDGIAALDDELRWFEDKLSERTLDTAPACLPVTAAYLTFLDKGLRTQPYAVLATAFFAIEYVYNQAWANVLGGDQRYQEFAERWGSKDFSAYVNLLQAQADHALHTASEAEQRFAEEVAGVKIPQLEAEFWQMAIE